MKQNWSFGIIPITTDGRVLMACRKDSIGFMEFVTGRYSLDTNKQTLIDLFNMMTKTELLLLLSCTYDEAYNKLFGNTKIQNNVLKEQQQQKFEHNRSIWLEVCKKVFNNGKGGWGDAEWGFPKGKKNKTETGVDCALRELFEETNIQANMVTVDPTKKYIEKRCEGNTEYICEYYVGHLSNDFKINDIKIQTSEISKVGLFDIDECITKVRHYFKSRINIIKTIKNLLDIKINHQNQ
jgi:predicted NUDIX family NTP pyrophosphohydrolase